LRQISKQGGRALFLAIALLCTVVGAAPYVIGPGGEKKIIGSSVKVANDGSILLTTQSGVLTFPKGTAVYVDKPEAYDAAVRMIQSREWDRAVDALQKIVRDYRLLQWDNRAKALLARVYAEKGEYEKAVAAYDETLKEIPGILEEDEVRRGYLKALRGAGQVDRLMPVLGESIANSSRELAAQALMMRAQLYVQQGELTLALYDFVIVAEMFRDIPEVQPEALFKAAEILGKLGDPKAAEFTSRLAKEYPDSSFAGQARTKMQKPQE